MNVVRDSAARRTDFTDYVREPTTTPAAVAVFAVNSQFSALSRIIDSLQKFIKQQRMPQPGKRASNSDTRHRVKLARLKALPNFHQLSPFKLNIKGNDLRGKSFRVTNDADRNEKRVSFSPPFERIETESSILFQHPQTNSCQHQICRQCSNTAWPMSGKKLGQLADKIKIYRPVFLNSAHNWYW